jgi:hypothetical protein
LENVVLLSIERGLPLQLSVHYGYNYTADPDQPAWFIQQWLDYYGPEKPPPISEPAEQAEQEHQREEL